MLENKTKGKETSGTFQKGKAAEIANTFEWLITAFILAFVVRAFVMEAFRIPTGSMAPTLNGAHFSVRCDQCGYKYNHGFIPQMYGLPTDTVPSGDVEPSTTRCPSCGNYVRPANGISVLNGDRILVLKCIYQFFEPKRWDVVVFKDPLEPSINYIKRLVALQGETIEIIDGDVYIDGKITRKPPKVQRAVWMPVYNNDYQPIKPLEGSFNGHIWQQPFKVAGSDWKINDKNPSLFTLDSTDSKISELVYDDSVGNSFKVTYAYNDIRNYRFMPYCSDLKVRFYCTFENEQSCIGASLSKYGIRYSAKVDLDGEMVITKIIDGQEPVELIKKSISKPLVSKSVLTEFANVDHMLIFKFADEELVYDLGLGPDDAGQRNITTNPEVKILAAGKLSISHVAIFRDIHYTGKKFVNSPEEGRAIEGNPFVLAEDEFFMLGDNSPNSEDCRWWDRPGIGNNGVSYRAGIVPRDYLIGKALFIYWPSWFKPFPKSKLRLVPNVGEMKFICGGSDKKQ